MKVLYILPVVSSLFVTSACTSKIRTMGTINNEAKSILKTEAKKVEKSEEKEIITKEQTPSIFSNFIDTKAKVISGAKQVVSKVIPIPVSELELIRKIKWISEDTKEDVIASRKNLSGNLVIKSNEDALLNDWKARVAFLEWYKARTGQGEEFKLYQVVDQIVPDSTKRVTLENTIITFVVKDRRSVCVIPTKVYSFNIKRKSTL